MVCIIVVKFIKALEQTKIATIVIQKGTNNKTTKSLKLTFETNDKDTIRVFKVLYDLNIGRGCTDYPRDVFDPLKMFHIEEDHA